MATRAAAASETPVALAAREALVRGNAVDAVVAALLVAAAESPGVLLGPLQVLVSGGGAGRVAVDGRLRQPGLGMARPRGTMAGDSIPAAARVAVPALPATLVALLASFGTAPLKRLAGPAVKVAAERSSERAAVLDAFARRGAPSLGDDVIATPLLAVAGRAVGGALTDEDLGAVRPEIRRVDEPAVASSGWLRVPWQAGASDASAVHVVAAADRHGIICVACYESPVEGLVIPELGLLAPASAEPVLRGRTRVRPGEPRAAAAPIAVRTCRGIADLGVGLACNHAATSELLGALQKLDEAPILGAALSAMPGRPVAVVRTREAAVVVASA